MTNAMIFSSVTARFGLPLLFAGQAQKEVFVNEAHALTDSLLHCAIERETAIPPGTPLDGTAWLIAAGAAGEWLGKDGAIACRQAGNWLYVMPRAGMQVRDLSNGQVRYFLDQWNVAATPVEPIGGPVIDIEARAAILGLTKALRIAGILPSS